MGVFIEVPFRCVLSGVPSSCRSGDESSDVVGEDEGLVSRFQPLGAGTTGTGEHARSARDGPHQGAQRLLPVVRREKSILPDSSDKALIAVGRGEGARVPERGTGGCRGIHRPREWFDGRPRPGCVTETDRRDGADGSTTRAVEGGQGLLESRSKCQALCPCDVNTGYRTEGQ
jgi:hypothetical protein